MLALGLERARSVLCIGAHADDIEIGCGGTVLSLLGRSPKRSAAWIVFSARGRRAAEARSSAGLFLSGASARTVVLKQFRESFFPYDGARIKAYFEQLKRSVRPDLIFTHWRHDRHQDHRVLAELTWNTFRDHLILEYEIPKYEGDLGQPNVFVPLDEAICRRKAQWICKSFQTQADKQWFSADTFLSLMRIRGIECASPTRYAEAFHGRKLVCA